MQFCFRKQDLFLLLLFALLIPVVVTLCGCSRNSNPPDKSTSSEADENVVVDAESSHQKMLDRLSQIEKKKADSNPYLGNQEIVRLENELGKLDHDRAINAKKWYALLKLGEQKLRLGLENEAIQQLSKAAEMVPDVRSEIGAEGEIENYFQLGVAYMRMGESENCCKRHNADSCIIPIRGGGLHVEKTGSSNAIENFSQVLKLAPQQHRRYRQSRWLLNLAYMTLGEYPDGVPEEYVFGRDAFVTETTFPRFVNVATHLGVDVFDLSGGAIADDFDGDHYLDLLTSSWDTAGQLRYFRNNQQGKFVDMTEAAGLNGITGGLNLVQADYDNDGDVDVFVLRGAWIGDAGTHPNSLLRNDGNGCFTDVTFLAGLAAVNYPTQTASWADYDNDGDLDLYVGNETTSSIRAPCQLFQNNGKGSFTDVATAAGVLNYRFTKAVVWGDYNADRFPDIYVSNLTQANRLFRNNKDGTFTDVAEELGVSLPRQSFPAWFWDYDNDGHLDIFVSSYDGRAEHVNDYYVHQTSTAELACLYRGDGQGGFEDVSLQVGLDYPMLPMGSNFGDLDGDGFLDFYLGTGDPDFFNLVPNLMYLNRAGAEFVDVSMPGGFAHLQKGHGVAFADFDNDGDNDVFEQMGGAFPGDAYPNALYENPGFGNHWIAIRLLGNKTNRLAVGARIHIVVEQNGTSRSIYRHINSGGSFGANPLRPTIGIGNADRINKIEIYWPTTDRIQEFFDVPLDQSIQIVEGEQSFTSIPLKKFAFEKNE